MKEFCGYSKNDMMRDWPSCLLGPCVPKLNIAIKWSPPSIGNLKVNVDGASFRNPGLARYGCVLQNSRGQILWVKAGPIGVQNALFTKLVGILEGLRLLKAMDLRGCIVEGDSMTTFSWGRGGRCHSWRLHHFIVEIRSLVKELDAVLSHIPYAQNAVPNSLAKWSVDQHLLFEGDHMPR